MNDSGLGSWSQVGAGGLPRHEALAIALGSAAELSNCLLLARDPEYLTQDEWKKLEELRNRTGQPVRKLKQAISSKPTPT